MSEHVAISPQEAADRLAIRELVEAYAHCADRRDAKGQMALFTEDTHFVVYMNAKDSTPSQELHSREALVPVFAALNQYTATMHFLGQTTILSHAPSPHDRWWNAKTDDCGSPVFGPVREDRRHMAVCGAAALCRLAGGASTIIIIDLRNGMGSTHADAVPGSRR